MQNSADNSPPPDRIDRPVTDPHQPASSDEIVCVLGLWHLGLVTAACMAEAGNTVIGIDPEPGLADALNLGRLPVAEPGLSELVQSEAAAGRLTFAAEPAQAMDRATVVWVTFDTPVDSEDRADVASVLESVEHALTSARDGTLVIISSQLPVGSIGELERRCNRGREAGSLSFACIPENLRLGKALTVFREPDRIIAGVRGPSDQARLASLLEPISANIEWMSVESAEMTKHALNSFLATSVAFINEVATICEHVGADAGEVARGLKSEERIGPRAYLSPGDAFAGGTLARDLTFLRELANDAALPSGVVSGVLESNLAHRQWARGALQRALLAKGADAPSLEECTVAIWGLTYKPGTDTLRRSAAVELCHWLIGRVGHVRAHDPLITELPGDLGDVELAADPLEAAAGADVLVVSTAWPVYREITVEALRAVMPGAAVLDAAGFLKNTLGADASIRYTRVGSRAATEDGSSV